MVSNTCKDHDSSPAPDMQDANVQNKPSLTLAVVRLIVTMTTIMTAPWWNFALTENSCLAYRLN